MAAPDELPIEPRRRTWPERVTTYGRPCDPFLVMVDVWTGCTVNGTPLVTRTVRMKPKLDFVSIDFTIGEDKPPVTT